jgi:hypothetical protein
MLRDTGTNRKIDNDPFPRVPAFVREKVAVGKCLYLYLELAKTSLQSTVLIDEFATVSRCGVTTIELSFSLLEWLTTAHPRIPR